MLCVVGVLPVVELCLCGLREAYSVKENIVGNGNVPEQLNIPQQCI